MPNTEFKDAAVALNAASEAGREFDPNNLTLFKGTRSTCSKAIFGATNCCVPRGFPVIGACSAAEKALCTSSAAPALKPSMRVRKGVRYHGQVTYSG